MKKTRNIIARMLGFVAVAFMLATTSAIATPSTQGTAIAPHSQVLNLAQAQAAPAAQAPATQPAFDGAKLYKAVFEALRDYHFQLQDPQKRAQWVAQWENKHANDHAFDTEESSDRAVREMIQSLGQRFDYYQLPEANQAEQDEVQSTLVGIGAQLNQHGYLKAVNQVIEDAKKAGTKPDLQKIKDLAKLSDDRPAIITEPMEGGPAEKAGIKAGDRIIKVDGNPVNGKTLNEMVKGIRGKDGTKVQITIERADGKGGKVEQTFDITRAKVVSHPVKFKDLGNGISYIRLANFMSQFAEDEMAAALTKAAKGKAIIFDLRGNPGGRLEAAETIGQYFLDHGPLVTLKQRKGDDMVETRILLEPDFALVSQKNSSKPGQIGLKNGEREDVIVPQDMPIIVLVDEGSASASEILAGLLQANHRAIVVGHTSVGKGVGQNVIQLPFDRNIHVTSFEFLPGGVAMDWVGVVPDVIVDQPKLADPEDLLTDPSKDAQLTAATKAAQEAVSKGEAAAKARQDIRQKNEDEFKKALDEAKKENKPDSK